MRRSKALPAKTIRNYRSVSQRRMTEFDGLDETAEIERLRQLLTSNPLQQQQDHHQQHQQQQQQQHNDQDLRDGEESHLQNDDQDDNPYEIMLTDDPILLPTKRKKTVDCKPRVELTPAEIKHAKAERKNIIRKLKQLEQRAAQKIQRQAVFAKLAEHQLSSDVARHLQSSATLGHKQTRRERLQALLEKERAGVTLTQVERDELYQTRNTVEDDTPTCQNIEMHKTVSAQTATSTPIKCTNPSPAKKQKTETALPEIQQNSSQNNVSRKTKMAQAPSAADFAAQMMASLTKLKDETANKQGLEETAKEDSLNQLSTQLLPSKDPKTKTRQQPYIPTEPTILKTAASLGLKPVHPVDTLQAKVLHQIQRPPHVQLAREQLPVTTMEFEIMDAIRTSDVTILCGETGSGKSTQTPQFLYEHGLTSNGSDDQHYQIAITQPRRVAAVSTAKRVAFEMNCGNGHTIQSALTSRDKADTGNLVAYQTRYEAAGLGISTRIKFMTDGILLQEIRADFLLRKYSVIVLDEAHERNLNTDVLIGLLSAAIPLRNKAAAESNGTLVPLKIVIMSATLRVQDFTENERLFAWTTPSVVRVPGRTFPVTIHHAKTTEIDDYEGAALRKVIKIHRKLPAGGILVFLTGKQEIIRMVNQLEKSLNGIPSSCPSSMRILDSYPKNHKSTESTIDVSLNASNLETLRDLDDEEADGDIFNGNGVEDDGDDSVVTEDYEHPALPPDDSNSGIPGRAIILPLYSLLSTEDQAKVFRPVPEGHRLIVVATNVAETSITIPGITYVVDTGRQKCRNYDSGTGVASYDVMWISKAAADQRAGRAGRTGPGHCYRIYSSSLYSRQMDAFGLPEVLTRPLEDVVLAMKAMRVSNVSKFPFPTPPDSRQLQAAVTLLADLGCVDTRKDLGDGSADGEITKLGDAVAKLPLGVRYGKMILVAAEAGILDYGIAVVSSLSENSPFVANQKVKEDNEVNKNSSDSDDEDPSKSKEKTFWSHRSGDILATVMAIGAYTHAGQNAGGATQRLACKRFCEKHGLNPVIMERIHNMRVRLTRLLESRLVHKSKSSKGRDNFHSLRPPNKLEERLLSQSIASGLLDHVATLAPVATFSPEHPLNLRLAYLGATSDAQEPLFLDRNSVLYTGDSRQLPRWVCYDALVRKTHKSGRTIVAMKAVTAIDPSWLGTLAKGSKLLCLGSPQVNPMPKFCAEADTLLCSVTTKFGRHSWEVAPLRIPWNQAFFSGAASRSISADDFHSWFARSLLEGQVIPEFDALRGMLFRDFSVLTNKKGQPKAVTNLIVALRSADLNSRSALISSWCARGPRFLWPSIRPLIRPERMAEAERLWVGTARHYMGEISK